MSDSSFDSSAIFRPGAVALATGAKVGPFCILGEGSPQIPGVLQIGENATVRSHTVLYAGSRIGPRFVTGHGALVRHGCKIGSDVSVGSHSVVEFDVTIGDRVRIHSQAFIPELTIIEDEAWIGPGVTFTNAKYPASPTTKQNLRGVRIGRGAIIGARAVVLPGVHIGSRALVGAGALVVRDVKDGEVVAGFPARVVGHIDRLRDYQPTRTT